MTERLAADAAGIARAAALLCASETVAFPTETVYGLGADATDAGAVAAIFAAKGRPRFNPLIAHYASAAAAFADVVATPLAERLAQAFWPGPLTLVLPRRATSVVADLVSAGLSTLAVRVPAHPVALALLAAAAHPVAAPSANRSGRVSPTTAAHVLAELEGRIAAVIDAGECPVGVESTVLDLTGARPRLLRPGGISLEALAPFLGALDAAPLADAGQPLAPGMLKSHYAPTLPLRLGAREVAGDEALLAFGPPLPGAALVFQLSATRNLEEAAARLYAGLRTLDAEGGRRGLAGIAAMTIPEIGLGCALNDRLARAAYRDTKD
ncbi:MAG: L-threonylcarbamoyladenylate synthase [Acidibrevibacterium sp.]|uniref:L-threonylcarbamoyladenylate synthase n=1 Tax=Acidibrevibacterium sp. TaxID=2606776 RepID=UPI003D01963C